MIRLCVFVGLIWVVCLGLIAGAQTWGRSQAAPNTFLAPGDCQLPCWQGERPGEVTAEALQQIVDRTGAFSLTWTDGNDEGNLYDGVARQFWLRPKSTILFGDVIGVLGPPEETHCLRILPSDTGLAAAAEVHYAGGTIQMVVENHRNVHMSPDMQVAVIKYAVPYWALDNHDTHVIAWQGFAGPAAYPCPD